MVVETKGIEYLALLHEESKRGRSTRIHVIRLLGFIIIDFPLSRLSNPDAFNHETLVRGSLSTPEAIKIV